jgi:alcohol dehydrogenase
MIGVLDVRPRVGEVLDESQILGSNGWTPDDLVTLLQMVEARRLVPVIDRVLPLGEAREGIRLLADREVIGKVVVVP